MLTLTQWQIEKSLSRFRKVVLHHTDGHFIHVFISDHLLSKSVFVPRQYVLTTLRCRVCCVHSRLRQYKVASG
jgi:hypothetical protein